MSFVCTTCDEKFETVPDGAVQITFSNRRVNSYRFADGSVHFLRNCGRGSSTRGLHNRWHQNKKKPECVFCFPPLEPNRQSRSNR